MSKKILIIEDEQPVHRALGSVLMPEEYELVTATDGESGVQFALTEKPDFIILDIMLPGIDGVEVLRRIREDDWGKDVPVLVLTNLSDSVSQDELEKMNILNYLVKSNVSLEDLVKIVEDYLKS